MNELCPEPRSDCSIPSAAGKEPPSARLALLTAILVGLLLRTHCLFHPYLWLDEYVTLWGIEGSNYTAMFQRSLHWTTNGPLFVLLYRVAVDLAGTYDLGLKLPGMIAGTVAIWAVWWTARQIFLRGDVALAAAWLVALGPQFIHFSQEARPYMIGSLLIILASGFLASWIRTGRRRDLAVVVVLTWAAVGIHLLAILLIGAFNLAVLAAGLRLKWARARWLDWGAAQVLIVAGLCLTGIQLPLLGGRRTSLIIETSLPMPIRFSLDHSVWVQAQWELTILLIGAGFWFIASQAPHASFSVAWRRDWSSACLAGCFYLIPSMALTSMAAFHLVDCYARYYFLFYSGWILALSWLLIAVFPNYLSKALTIAVLGLMTTELNYTGAIPSCRFNGEWRNFPREEETMRQRIGANELVLSRSGLIEANQLAFLTNSLGASYLKCPCEAKNGAISSLHMPLPFSPEKRETKQYLVELFESTVLGHSSFWLINFSPMDYDYNDWIIEHYGTSLRRVEHTDYPVFTLTHYVNDRWVEIEEEKKGTSDKITATVSEVPCQRYSH